MTSATGSPGSAERWGPLWGSRPDDWALSEDQQLPSYEAALGAFHRAGSAGARRRLRVARSCGSPQTVARTLRPRRIRSTHRAGPTTSPGSKPACRRHGSAPYDANTFDLVTGFTSFFFANDMVAAASRGRPSRQAGRSRRDPGVGRPRTLFPRGDEGDRKAVLPATPSRRPTRPRPLPTRRTRSPRDRSRTHARNQLPNIVGLYLPRPGNTRPSARRPSRRRDPRRTRARRSNQSRDRRGPRALAPGRHLPPRQRYHYLIARA